MESAFMFVEKWVETPSKEQGSHLDQLKRMVAERDAAIRAEDRQLPRAMIDEFDAMRETYDTAEAIARRYGYTVKED